MLAERDEIARLVSRETGKPVAEAISMEIVPTLDAMHYFAHASENCFVHRRSTSASTA